MKTKSKKSAPATIEDFSKPLTVEKAREALNEADRQYDQARETAAGKKERFQLSFDLNPDGSPDLDGMREGTKKKVQEFFTDARMASAFGAKAPAPKVELFQPAMVSGFYDLLGTMETMFFGSVMKLPEPIARRVFTYTPPEKEALTGPTVRVLNKYVPDWMIKYQDEIALATLLGSLTIQKVNAAQMLAKMNVSTPPQAASQEENDENDKKEGPGGVVAN